MSKNYDLKVTKFANKRLVKWMESGIYDIGMNTGSAQKNWFNHKMKDLLNLMKKCQVTTKQAEDLYELAQEETNNALTHKAVEKEIEKRKDIEEDLGDRHCETCMCDITDDSWNKAEDDDSHCPTCSCDKKLPPYVAYRLADQIRHSL